LMIMGVVPVAAEENADSELTVTVEPPAPPVVPPP